MRVLVLNCGSSSLKYRLFDMRDERLLSRGLVERIGFPGSSHEHRTADGGVTRAERAVADHEVAVRAVITALREQFGAGFSVDAIGHRVVQGAETFPGPARLDDRTVEQIDGLSELAPLHNPAAVLGMRACAKVLPEVPGVAVFDTSFHQTLPPAAYLYAIPFNLYERYRIRRYGFHGTSHKFVAQEAARFLGRDLVEMKLITCHLGNGSSLCAIRGGQSVDTSMGFTPLAGVVMGTRCGDIDPAVVPFLMQKERMSVEEAVELLNRKSGVLGLSGLSHDFRDLESAAEGGDTRADSALNVFVYSVRRFIGSYVVTLNGLDAVVFTGGLGENSELVRARVCDSMDFLGIAISHEKNNSRAWPADISEASARTRVLVIPTNEELMIAREAVSLLSQLDKPNP